MNRSWKSAYVMGFVALTALAGCDENGDFALASPEGASEGGAAQAARTSEGAVVTREVEAPDEFEATETGLWDGRPSIGGVWVTHPDVTEPGQVLVRNSANGNEIVSALYRRVRKYPGPPVQVSSEAATGLGLLAGQPAQLYIVALRREEVPITPADPLTAETADTAAPGEISEQSLDPIAAAAAAIDEAEQGTPPAVETAAAAPAPASTSSLSDSYVQIGIFSVEANANNAAASLRNIGIVPTIRRQSIQDKEYWRVIVGPATTRQERTAILEKVKGLGFTDAYFVKG